MSFFDDTENYAPTDSPSPRQREKSRRYQERRAAEAKATEAERAELIQKVTTAATLIGVSLVTRWQVVRAIQTLGYSKRDARVLTTGLCGAAWIVSYNAHQGRHAYQEGQKYATTSS